MIVVDYLYYSSQIDLICTHERSVGTIGHYWTLLNYIRKIEYNLGLGEIIGYVGRASRIWEELELY